MPPKLLEKVFISLSAAKRILVATCEHLSGTSPEMRLKLGEAIGALGAALGLLKRDIAQPSKAGRDVVAGGKPTLINHDKPGQTP